MSLVLAFQGTAEETAAYMAALNNLGLALNTDPVQAARDAYEATGVTLTQSYSDQMESLRTLIGDYDGSLVATQQLSQGLQHGQEMAYALASQLLAAAASLDDLTESSAKSIRQSIMSEEELRTARQGEINALAAELEVLSDPSEIKGTVSEIERLNRQVFDSLGPEAQKAQAEAFAGFIEQVNEKAQERLEIALSDLEKSQEEINATIGDALGGAADTMSGAASTMLAAAQAIPDSFSVNVNQTVTHVNKPAANDEDIPGFARGGLARPGLAIVGEEGPELVRFNKPGFVHTASQTRSMLSGAGGDDTKAELQALAVMMSRQLKLWQRVTRNGESLRTVAA